MRKGKYKVYWYGIVRDMLKCYNSLDADKSVQATIYKNAIDKAIAETMQMDNGELRVKAIRRIYFEGANNFEIVADEIGYERRTIERWVSSFVRLVGKNAGF